MRLDANEIRSPVSEGSFELHIWQGTGYNFALNRRTGTARGGMGISYTERKLLLMQYAALFYTLRDLSVCWTRDGLLFIYTSQSPLFAFVLAPKLIYTPMQTALYKRLTHSVYLKPSTSSFTHGQQKAEHQSTVTYYMTPLCD